MSNFLIHISFNHRIVPENHIVFGIFLVKYFHREPVKVKIENGVRSTISTWNYYCFSLPLRISRDLLWFDKKYYAKGSSGIISPSLGQGQQCQD